MDEKRTLAEGDVVEVYEVEPLLESDAPQPQRPVWRRFLRVLITMGAFFMIFSTFGSMMPHCSRKHANHLPNMHDGANVATKPKTHFTFPSDLSDFKIKQESQSALPTRTQVYGKVVVGSCPKAENISVYFDIHVSDDGLWEKIKIEPRENGIFFSADATSIVKQAVNITAYVVVPSSKKYKLKTFQVETRELNIKLSPSFKTVVNGTYFETISGNISSYGKNNMDIVLSPYLSAKSVSGSIFGRFGLGKTLDLESGSGMVAVNITSAPFNEVDGKLTTKTISGGNYVTFGSILHPRPLISTHISVSGNVKVHYPEDWQGSAKLESTTGHIGVYGEGTSIVKKKNGATGRFYKAIKGVGKSKAYFGTVSGDIVLAVGKTKCGGKSDIDTVEEQD